MRVAAALSTMSNQARRAGGRHPCRHGKYFLKLLTDRFDHSELASNTSVEQIGARRSRRFEYSNMPRHKQSWLFGEFDAIVPSCISIEMSPKNDRLQYMWLHSPSAQQW